MSAGKVFVYRRGPSSVSGRLYDFDVGKGELKAEHEKWLFSNVVGILNAGGSLTAIGLTSRTDTPEFNLGLSLRRVQSVVRYLRTHSRNSFKVITEIGVGERAAQLAGVKDGVENKNWRAVVLNVWNLPYPPPPPLPPPPKLVEEVERRVTASFLATYKINDRGATANDGPAPKIADAQMAIMHEKRLRDGGYQPVYENKQAFPKNVDKIIMVTVFASASNHELLVGGAEMNSCHVRYDWDTEYPSKAPILLWHYHRVGAFSNNPPFAYRLTEDRANLWLNDPPKAFSQPNNKRGESIDHKKVIKEFVDSGGSWTI